MKLLLACALSVSLPMFAMQNSKPLNNNKIEYKTPNLNWPSVMVCGISTIALATSPTTMVAIAKGGCTIGTELLIKAHALYLGIKLTKAYSKEHNEKNN